MVSLELEPILKVDANLQVFLNLSYEFVLVCQAKAR